MKISTPEERKNIVAEVEKKVAQGSSIRAALKSIGLVTSQYYKWRAELGRKNSNSLKSKKATKPTMLSIPVDTESGTSTNVTNSKVALFIGSPQDVAKAYREFMAL